MLKRKSDDFIRLRKKLKKIEDQNAKINYDVQKLKLQNSNKNDLESSSIKLILVSFVHSFTGHDFNKLVIAKNPILKAFWTLFILLGTAGCMYYINMNIQEFFQYNVFTNIITKYSSDLTFPAITICPPNGTLNLDIMHCQFEYIHAHSCNFTNITIYNKNFERYNCFIINGPEQHHFFKTTQYGYRGGFYFTLFIPIEGIYYFIGNNLYEPTYSDLNGVFVGGKVSYVTINKVRFSHLGPPFKSCLEDLKMKTTNISFYPVYVRNSLECGFEYRQINCYKKCLSYKLASKCNCTIPGCDGNTEDSDCSPHDECIKEGIPDFNYPEICSDCPLECSSVDISVRKESENLLSASQKVLDFVSNKYNMTNSTEVAQRTLELYVYFENMKYMEISEKPSMTLNGLISNIGGTIGLFLGMSVMSLIEVLELIFSMGCILAKRL